MSDSILTSVKKALGLDPDYTPFDVDVVIHINSALSTLNQLGVGPPEGYSITDSSALWSDFLGVYESRLEFVKTYVYLKVRLIFDPPTAGFVLTSIEKQILELEWRINVECENLKFQDAFDADVIDHGDGTFSIAGDVTVESPGG